MNLILTTLFLTTVHIALAQTTVTGIVAHGKGDPIPGANVIIKDSYDGASTSADGTFTFNTSETGAHTLIVTYIGYKEAVVNINLNATKISVKIQLKEEINNLDAVVISAGSFTAGDENRRTILKALDIATTAGATADIAGALNTLPGTQKVGESGRLFVRGGDGNETRTFIDGMVVLDPYNSSAPNTPSRGRFLPFMFKGTSFSTGGYSAEYGQALSSALVLNSKDRSEVTQTDIGILSVGADVGHTQVMNRASWSGKVQYTDIRPYFHLINQVMDWKTPPVAIEGSSAFRQQVGKTGLLKLYGIFSNTTYSLFLHDINDPSAKQLMNMNNTYGYGNAVYQQLLAPKWNMRGGVSYSCNENAIRIEDTPMRQAEKGVHSKLVFENTISDAIETRLGAEVISREYSESKLDSVNYQKLEHSFHETITAPFVEAEAYASRQLVAKAGLRMEYDNLHKTAGVDPRISLAYKPGSRGQFSFAYGRFRQTAKNAYVVNQTDVGSEKSEHFIVNYQIVTNQRTFRIETYYKRYFDLIRFLDNDGSKLNNSGFGYAKGFELFWRDNKSINNVDYWISYSYLDTKRNYLNYLSSAIPSFASRHNFSAVYKHFITGIKTQLGVTYSYSSGRPYFNPNTQNFNSDRTPFYQDLSANLSFLPKNWIIIHASCTNLLGRNNIFGYQYSTTANSEGTYTGRPIVQPARHFLFLAVFITISKNKSVNQLPNL